MSKTFKEFWKSNNQTEETTKADQFKEGDRVQINADMKPDGGKKGKVIRTIGTGAGMGIKVNLDDGQSDTFGIDELKKI